MVPHGFKTFILLNCLICLWPALCLVNSVKIWLFFLWILGPRLGFVSRLRLAQVSAVPTLCSQAYDPQKTRPKKKEKKKNHSSLLFCIDGQLWLRAQVAEHVWLAGQGEGGSALVHIGSIPSKALVQTFFLFLMKKLFLATPCSTWDLVPPPEIEPSCSGSTES